MGINADGCEKVATADENCNADVASNMKDRW